MDFMVDIGVRFDLDSPTRIERRASHPNRHTASILGPFGAGLHGAGISTVGDDQTGLAQGKPDIIRLPIERIARLRAQKRFDPEETSPLGLGKVANRAAATGKKKKAAKTEEEQAPAQAAAPAQKTSTPGK